ncbi:hypothetical protein QAD02_016438 [Eretmocerus hayati]|uniref:Uncharacterized protein n=1 Tax=Eretmocerus hayati TaxID=131215 RepID=A0ACC2PCW5_9HYME|nr:hypothetical protein QAD02_016438 [Eretmocerus hayati]
MFTSKFLIQSLLLIFESNIFCIIVDQGPASISAVLKSYAEAGSTNKAREQLENQPFSNLSTSGLQPDGNATGAVTFLSPTLSSINKSAPIIQTKSVAEPTWSDTRTVITRKSEELSDGSTQESEDYSRDLSEPPDHVIPFSEHENPREPSTRPNYTVPGAWARPAPDKNISLDFVPTKLYAQVRGTHTVSHVPKEEAIKNAETDEEKANAARLREVVKVSKANTVYTEEGYEDAAYDHAGQIRDANFHEGFARNLDDEGERGSPTAHKKKIFGKNRKFKPRKGKSRNFEDLDKNYSSHIRSTNQRRTPEERIQLKLAEKLMKSSEEFKINPKIATLSGISQLERDLMQESDESTNSPTLQPSYSMINETLVTQPSTEQRDILEPTTIRYNVFTVRPKKKETSTQMNPSILRFRRPHEYHPEKKMIFNSQSGIQFHKHLGSTDVMMENTRSPPLASLGEYGGYNRVSITTYHPPVMKSETVNTASANPLAIATLNGHGPYLVVVTSPPNVLTPRSYDSQNPVVSVGNITPVVDDGSKSSSQNSPQHNSLLRRSSDQKLRVHEDVAALHDMSETDKMPFSSLVRVNIPSSTRSYDFKIESSLAEKGDLSSHMGTDNGSKNLVQNVPKSSQIDVFRSYSSEKLRRSHDAISKRISVHPENIHQMEDTRARMTRVQHLHPSNESQAKVIPATELLPPSPLSHSEYASFLRGMNHKPIPSFVMSLMPVIEDIHRRESASFPYLFRRKRSIAESNRDWHAKVKNENSPRYVRSRINSNHIDPKSHPIKEEYRKKFGISPNLLNESPHIVTNVVDSEINKRFNNVTRGENKSREVQNTLRNDEDSNKSNEASEEDISVDADLSDSDIDDHSGQDDVSLSVEPDIDKEKYPFYTGSSNTALEYMVSPAKVPHKTLGGMEFYISRDRECEDIDPNLERIVPDDSELDGKLGSRNRDRRLNGLGSKLDCYKAKYFDENPLDNPLFSEKGVKNPPTPPELDPYRFASRVLKLPSHKDEYVIPRGPKSPEGIKTPKTRNAVYEDVMGTIMNQNKMKKNRLNKKSNPSSRYVNHDQVRTHDMNTIEPRGSVMYHRRIPATQYIARQPSKKYKQRNVLGSRMNHPRRRNRTHRVYKRGIEAGSVQELVKLHNLAEQTDDKNANSNDTVVASRAPESPRRKRRRKNPVLVKEESDHVRSKNEPPDPSSADGGKFGKFQEGNTTVLDVRRNEPRYYVPKRKRPLTTSSTPTDHTVANISNHNTLVLLEPLSSSSTLIPVITRPEPNFSNGTSQQRESRVAATRLALSPSSNDEDNSKDDEVGEISRITPASNTKILGDDELVRVNPTEHQTRQHSTLNDFLKGDPPGYAAAFSNQESSHSVDDDAGTNRSDARMKNRPIERRNGSEEEDNSEEEYEEDSTSEDADEESTEESAVERPAHSDEKNGKNFERFSDRPYSPPENFEDEKYADLGPRINKPYFYHPSFEVPDYEKFKVETLANEESVDTSESDEENHERDKGYLKGRKDNEDQSDDDEMTSESRRSSLNRYEYPWEKRDRKHNDKREREHVTGKRLSVDSGEDEDEEATLTRPVYVALGHDYHNTSAMMNKSDKFGEDSSPEFKILASRISVTPADRKISVITTANETDIHRLPVNHLSTREGEPFLSSPRNQLVRSRVGGIPSTPSTLGVTQSPGIFRKRRVTKDNNTLTANDSMQSLVRKNLNNQSFVGPPRGGRSRNASNPHVDLTTMAPIKAKRRRQISPIKYGITSNVTTSAYLPHQDKLTPRNGIRGGMKYSSSQLVPHTSKSITSLPNTSGKTVEHHSRVSKQEIITKTMYPDDEKDQEEVSKEGEDSLIEKNIATTLAAPRIPAHRSRRKPQNASHKKERVEKVTITMEETPDHVYKTEEIDRDGVKGKFITIIPNTHNNNNNSTALPFDHDGFQLTEPNPHFTDKALSISEPQNQHGHIDGVPGIESETLPVKQITVAISLIALLELGLITEFAMARPGPDSAGIVPMPPGLAYGGIPYGSVSGNLANTIPGHHSSHYLYSAQQLPSSPLLVAI